MTATFEEGAETVVSVPDGFNALVYVLDGAVESNGTAIEKLNMGVYGDKGEGVHLYAKSTGKLLFLGGEPINEPMATYGPFVMNYPGEIKQAVLDYETGKMGVLES